LGLRSGHRSRHCKPRARPQRGPAVNWRAYATYGTLLQPPKTPRPVNKKATDFLSGRVTSPNVTLAATLALSREVGLGLGRNATRFRKRSCEDRRRGAAKQTSVRLLLHPGPLVGSALARLTHLPPVPRSRYIEPAANLDIFAGRPAGRGAHAGSFINLREWLSAVVTGHTSSRSPR